MVERILSGRFCPSPLRSAQVGFRPAPLRFRPLRSHALRVACISNGGRVISWIVIGVYVTESLSSGTMRRGRAHVLNEAIDVTAATRTAAVDVA